MVEQPKPEAEALTEEKIAEWEIYLTRPDVMVFPYHVKELFATIRTLRVQVAELEASGQSLSDEVAALAHEREYLLAYKAENKRLRKALESAKLNIEAARPCDRTIWHRRLGGIVGRIEAALAGKKTP